MKKLLIPALLLLAGLVMIGLHFFSSSDDVQLDLTVEKAELVMPAAHRVYANPDALNGAYYLFKAKITNNGRNTVENVEVSYQVPGFIEWTEVAQVGAMIPGQSVVVTCYPKFDPGITKKTTASVEKTDIRIVWDGATTEEELEASFSFKMLNRNDFAYTCIPSDEIAGWADVFDNNELLACYVTPNDPIVKYYTQIVQEKVMKGESASVDRSPKKGVQFLMGLYNATVMSHMVYSGTKGIPQALDDVQTMVQHIRLPREVITGNTGLCIELSAFYASVLSAAGLDPIIFLVPGHAYPGFRMNGQYYAIEATAIGGEGLGGIGSAEEAFKKGMKQLDEFLKAAQMGDPRYSLVDIHAMNAAGVTSMHLEDDDYLRKKVDEIAANFTPQQTQQNIAYENHNKPVPGGGGGNRFPGPLGFQIPSGWVTHSYPSPDVPVLTAQVVSPDKVTTVSIFDVPANDAYSALKTIAYYFSNLGMQLEYNIQGNTVVGNTYSYNGQFKWKGKIAPVSGGYRMVAVGADSRAYNQYAGTINSIFNSIK